MVENESRFITGVKKRRAEMEEETSINTLKPMTLANFDRIGKPAINNVSQAIMFHGN